MSYIDFFHSDAYKRTNNDIQLRIIKNKLINIGQAYNSYKYGSITKSTDTILTDSNFSADIDNFRQHYQLPTPLGSEDFTLSVWMKPYQWANASTSVVCDFHTNNNPNSDNNGNGPHFELYLRDDYGSHGPSIYYTVSPYTRYINHQNSATLNQWNHLALVQSGDKLNLYLNGIKASTTYTGYLLNGITYIHIFGYGNFPVVGSKHLMEDFYFTRKALWTDNFTPPTTYLPDEP